MSSSPTQHRLTQAALELFLSQGISHTTTRQIANMAEVNEATLFRNFGNKYGLLLAMLQEAPAFSAPMPLHGEYSAATLRIYLDDYLQLLEQFPNFVRSLIGEADQYPQEHRQALQMRLKEIRQSIANHLEQMLSTAPLAAAELASMVGAILVGYTVIETTSGCSLWENRDQFLDALVTLLTRSVDDSGEIVGTEPPPALIIDLPASWVQQLMKQTRSMGLQDHAIALVFFGAGLLPAEITQLERAHQICDKSQHILQIMGASGPRQVPVNQWILGKRYGSYTNNPLTKWLKSRKDNSNAMFINEEGEPMTTMELQERWAGWWDALEVEELPKPIQARQTWCVEMLIRGISLENLSILTGIEVADLQPYAQRAREKSAIAAATQLDRKLPAP